MPGITFFFFKQKTSYEMRISDWSSDVCSSDLGEVAVESQQRQVGDAADREPWPGDRMAERALGSNGRHAHHRREAEQDRKSVMQGKSVSVRVDIGGRRINTQKMTTSTIITYTKTKQQHSMGIIQTQTSS